MQPLISIIVPVYNVEKYLSECVNSLINQSYQNLEIILVDDGSTDKSGEICDEFAKIDRRVKVLHQKNGGQSSARNNALDIMRGKFVSFVDSDDLIDESYIEVLFDLIKKYETKIALCGYKNFSQNKQIKVIKEQNLKISNELCLSSFELFNKSLKVQTNLTKSIWRALYHKDIFANLRFPSGEIYEDVAIWFDIFNQSKTALSDKILYFYRYNPGSTSNSFNQKHFFMIKNVRKFATSIENAYPNLKNKAIAYKCNSALNMAFLIVSHKSTEYYDTLYDLHKFVRENLNFDFFKMQGSMIYRDILMILFYISPKLLDNFVNFIKKIKKFLKW